MRRRDRGRSLLFRGPSPTGCSRALTCRPAPAPRLHTVHAGGWRVTVCRGLSWPLQGVWQHPGLDVPDVNSAPPQAVSCDKWKCFHNGPAWVKAEGSGPGGGPPFLPLHPFKNEAKRKVFLRPLLYRGQSRRRCVPLSHSMANENSPIMGSLMSTRAEGEWGRVTCPPCSGPLSL